MKKINKDKKEYISTIATIIACITCMLIGYFANGFLSDRPKSQEWDKLETIYSILTNKWYYANQIEDVDSKLVEQAISGMSTLEEDAHTNYFSLEMAQKFSQSLEGSNVGVGFSYYLDDNKNFVVKNTFVNSPADFAGLKKGDIITSVGDMECAKSEAKDIVSMIKSSDGVALKVNYLRDGKECETDITPSSYDATVCNSIEDTYGVIELTSFSEYSAKEFNESIQRIKKAGKKKLIIDLRNNSGGYLKSVLDISSCLIPKDAVVFIENLSDGSKKEQISSNKYEVVDFDSIVVLQNGDTASAAEVLIGTLKDNLGDKVITVGTQSYGKGTEQVSVPFKDGTSIKYTVCEWSTPNGTSINLKGFEPDHKVELGEEQTVAYIEMEASELIEPDHVHTNAEALQTYLKFLGYNVDRTDQYFSPTSSQALAKFQKDQGIRSNGICDQTTWEKVKEVVLLEINKQEEKIDYPMLKAIELVK